jgi:hypothetical protein
MIESLPVVRSVRRNSLRAIMNDAFLIHNGVTAVIAPMNADREMSVRATGTIDWESELNTNRERLRQVISLHDLGDTSPRPDSVIQGYMQGISDEPQGVDEVALTGAIRTNEKRQRAEANIASVNATIATDSDSRDERHIAIQLFVTQRRVARGNSHCEDFPGLRNPSLCANLPPQPLPLHHRTIAQLPAPGATWRPIYKPSIDVPATGTNGAGACQRQAGTVLKPGRLCSMGAVDTRSK